LYPSTSTDELLIPSPQPEKLATGDEDGDKIPAPAIPHQSLEEAVVRNEAEGEVEGTEEPAFRTEDGGEVEDSLPVVFPTSEDSVVGERDKDEGLTENPREDDVRKDTLPTTSPTSEDRDGPTLEEPMVEEKDKEVLTEKPTSRKYDVGEENALPTVSQTLEDPLVKDGDQKEEEFAHAETQVKVEHTLPSGSLTTEEPAVIGEDKGVGEEELMVEDRDRDEEQSTVFGKDKVREEDALPTITLKSEEPMVGVEEKDKDQDTGKPNSRKDEEGAQPIVSLTSEEHVVGDGNQEQVEESTDAVVGNEDDVREDALPTTSPTSEDQNDPTWEEPMVKEKDKDDEELTEKPTFRKDGVGEENALPTASPTLEDPMVKDGDQKEEEYTEKQVKEEYALPSVSPMTEEPLVVDEDKGVEEGEELLVTGRDRDNEQSTVFGKDKVREEGVLPIITLKSEEPMVGVEKDKDQDTEKPTSRKDEEGTQPSVSLTSEEPVVGDGDQEQVEESTETEVGKEDEVGVEYALPTVSQSSEEPVVGDGDQEQVDESTETVVGKENDVREDTLPTTSPTSEDRDGPTLKEPIVEEDDEDLTEKPTFIKNNVGEENALPTAFPTLEEPMVKDGDQKGEEYTEKQVKVEYALPSRSPMTEEPLVVDEDKGVEEGEELLVTGRDRDEEQSTVFGNDRVREEDALPIITLKSEEPMVGVEEKGKDQDTEEPTSRKDEGGTQPIVSLTSEEPMVGDGDQEQVKESTETEVGKEDEVGVEYALPTLSQSSEEPVVGDVGKDGEKGTKDKDEVDEDEEKDAEERIVRGNSFQPILPPSPLMARGEDKDKKEDPDVKKPIPIPMVEDEDGEHKGTLPSSSEEPMVESIAEVKEEDKGVLLIPSQEPVATERGGELVGSMLPILSPSLEERKVRDEGNGEDHEESVAALPIHPPTSEEPIRSNGNKEEDELPIVTPSLEELTVEDGEEEEGNIFLPIPPQGEDQAIKEKDKGRWEVLVA